jgi:nucleoside-diphosphate-sugar epimerase
MARVVAFIPDLLFGSNVVGALRAAGHEVELVAEPGAAADSRADVVVVDLTADAADRIARVSTLDLGPARTLAFYSHVEAEVRAAAEAAGFDLVVPRSRMNREGPALVERLAETSR